MSITTRKAQGKIAHDIDFNGLHHAITDEPVSNGGDDLGPDPHDLFDASLAACTALTLMLYAKRKQWPLEDVRVKIDRDNHDERNGNYRLARQLELIGPLDAEQRSRLTEIADRCPIHRLMHAKIEISTTLV
jgi:putative redox protein